MKTPAGTASPDRHGDTLVEVRDGTERFPALEFVNWSRRPKLDAPIVLVAFGGWSDAGDAATSAVRFFGESWESEPFATIDPEPFYDFSSTRPLVQLDDNDERQIVWPENASDIDPLRNADAEAAIRSAVEAAGVPVLVGAVLREPAPMLSNASLLYRPGGGAAGAKDGVKQPFARLLLRGAGGGFQFGVFDFSGQGNDLLAPLWRRAFKKQPRQPPLGGLAPMMAIRSPETLGTLPSRQERNSAAISSALAATGGVKA